MKAMILAAGLGTRLRPLTEHTPKALIAVKNKPLLEWIILRLKHFGFDEIIINVHHHAPLIRHFLDEKRNFGIRIAVSEEGTLLDTGGGLKNAAWFFDDDQPFLLHNVDVLTDLDLNQLCQYHRHSNALATLAVRNRRTKRYLIFDQDTSLCGWKSLDSGETRIIKQCQEHISLSFMGIHVLSPRILPLLDEDSNFSIIKTYLRLVSEGHDIKGFISDTFRWLDLGRKEHLKRVNELFDEHYFSDISKTPQP